MSVRWNCCEGRTCNIRTYYLAGTFSDFQQFVCTSINQAEIKPVPVYKSWIEHCCQPRNFLLGYDQIFTAFFVIIAADTWRIKINHIIFVRRAEKWFRTVKLISVKHFTRFWIYGIADYRSVPGTESNNAFSVYKDTVCVSYIVDIAGQIFKLSVFIKE